MRCSYGTKSKYANLCGKDNYTEKRKSIKKPAQIKEQVLGKRCQSFELLQRNIKIYEAISIRFNKFLFKVCFA